MISWPGDLRVYLAAGVTDMRKSIDTLAVLVAERLDLDPLSGHLFGFCSRKRDTIKILYWDNNGELVELNIQIDHVHLLVLVPPKESISNVVGTLKGRTAIRVFNRFRKLKNKPYWGNHFWSCGYCVDTVSLDEEMVRKYIKYQEKEERRHEQQDRLF